MQLRLVAAEKKPMVFMNSLTGMPLRTWMFLYTSSAISGFSAAGDGAPCAASTETVTHRPMATTPSARRVVGGMSGLFRRRGADAKCRITNQLSVIDHLGRHAHLLF